MGKGFSVDHNQIFVGRKLKGEHKLTFGLQYDNTLTSKKAQYFRISHFKELRRGRVSCR